MVILTALIRTLEAEFGLPVDVLTSGPWSEPLLVGQPGVGTVISVRSRRAPYWISPDQWRAVRWLRSRPPGPVWYCDANDAARALVERAGIPAALIVDVRDHPLKPGEHASEHWRRLGQICPEGWTLPAEAHERARAAVEALPGGCSLEVSATARRELTAWLDSRGIGAVPMVLVQAGNKRTMRRGPKRLAVNHKYWPQERWAGVIRHVRARRPEHAIVLIGTGPEWTLNEQLLARAGVERCYNVADDLPIPRLVALLERAAALLSVDSGPAHAAAAVGCPQVVLFGRASPSLYRPRGAAGADVKLLQGEHAGTSSMLGITSEEVNAAFDELRLRTPAL
jgi:heptosyltransferase-3